VAQISPSGQRPPHAGAPVVSHSGSSGAQRQPTIAPPLNSTRHSSPVAQAPSHCGAAESPHRTLAGVQEQLPGGLVEIQA
jgi:hypothetical protein